MKKLELIKGTDAYNPSDLMDRFNEDREVINALIDEKERLSAELAAARNDLNTQVEKLAKVDGEVGGIKERLKLAENALMVALKRLGEHTHDAQGHAVAPLC